MAILDKFIPVYYKILKMGIRQDEIGVAATYDIALFNSEGNRIHTMNQESILTSQEKQAIGIIFQRDKAAFEAATGLIEIEE